jgi:outer membrane protein OmpA-like peptidoglycan-associated protein
MKKMVICLAVSLSLLFCAGLLGAQESPKILIGQLSDKHAALPAQPEPENQQKEEKVKTENTEKPKTLAERVADLEDKVNFHHPKTEVSGLNNFGLGKAELDESAKEYLKTLANKVRNKEIEILEIIGHADISMPKNEKVTNEIVSLQRAHAAISYLIEEKIETSDIKITGAGETERYGEKSKNRRITIIVKKLN